MFRIESLLSARTFLRPQLVGDFVYFISNLDGKNSLYRMKFGGSVPEPLLPPNIALQNPHLIGGYSFFVFPDIQQILVMIDQDGDENYLPMVISLEGGFPEPAFNNFFAGTRDYLVDCGLEDNSVYLVSDSRKEALQTSYRGNLKTGEVVKLDASPYGATPTAHSRDHNLVVISDGYTTGDSVLFLLDQKHKKTLILGTPLEQRKPGEDIPLTGIASVNFVQEGNGLLLTTALFSDLFTPAYIDLRGDGKIKEVKVQGIQHKGLGELVQINEVEKDLFIVEYNIDGCSWVYEAIFEPSRLTLELLTVLIGAGELADGMLEAIYYEKSNQRYIVSFSTATSPSQIYSIEGNERNIVVQHTQEKVLGIKSELLSAGEDASFVSYDGLRVSARLYLPAERLGFFGKRPLVYYVHGGPQGQERPDFTWFSMPLIQYLTLNGFAVFVPNVRGSLGYGLSYTKKVDRDWGGDDRLDHVHALRVLANDARVDVTRSGVVGRSYGGYMTLTLAGRHPDLWKAAVDMFGPFDLVTFLERIPPTWKPYFKLALGEVETDRAFLMERSPKTYIDQIQCPLLVIQGKNDPRVVEQESHDLVEHLRSTGKQVDYLMFENEGHDVLKYENRVRCYNAITEYFKQYLKP